MKIRTLVPIRLPRRAELILIAALCAIAALAVLTAAPSHAAAQRAAGPLHLSRSVVTLHPKPGESVQQVMTGLPRGQRFAVVTGRWLCDDKAGDTSADTCVKVLNGSGAQEWVAQPFGSYSGISLGTVGNGCVFRDSRFTSEYRGDPCFEIADGGSWLRGVTLSNGYGITGTSSPGADTSPMVGVGFWSVNINVTNLQDGYPHGSAMDAGCLADCKIWVSDSGTPTQENQWAVINF